MLNLLIYSALIFDTEDREELPGIGDALLTNCIKYLCHTFVYQTVFVVVYGGFGHHTNTVCHMATSSFIDGGKPYMPLHAFEKIPKSKAGFGPIVTGLKPKTLTTQPGIPLYQNDNL
jgi:hypothetical protein